MKSEVKETPEILDPSEAPVKKMRVCDMPIPPKFLSNLGYERYFQDSRQRRLLRGSNRRKLQWFQFQVSEKTSDEETVKLKSTGFWVHLESLWSEQKKHFEESNRICQFSRMQEHSVLCFPELSDRLDHGYVSKCPSHINKLMSGHNLHQELDSLLSKPMLESNFSSPTLQDEILDSYGVPWSSGHEEMCSKLLAWKRWCRTYLVFVNYFPTTSWINCRSE